MWLEARVRPKGGEFRSGQDFRGFAATALDQRNTVQRLFWRSPDHVPLPERPTISFVGTQKWVGIRVCSRTDHISDIAEAHRDAVLALESMLTLSERMDREWGAGHAIEIIKGDHGVEPDRFTRYHINKLAMPRHWSQSYKRHDALKAAMPACDSPTREAPVDPAYYPAIKELILKGLRERFPQHATLFVNQLEFVQPLMWTTPMATGGALVFVLRHVVFTLPHRLVGPVQVGRLQSRGLGDIQRTL